MKDENIKLLYSHYDPETGVSIVRIQTSEGMFKGKARVHPDDQDIASSYTGCRYAELRAYIKFCKYKARLLQHSIKELTKVYNQISQNKEMPKRASRYCLNEINILKEEKNEWLTIAKDIKEEINISITERDKILSKIKKAKTN